MASGSGCTPGPGPLPHGTELAKRIAGDPLLTLVLTAWDLEVRLRNGGSDTDGPVGIAVAPVVSMLFKLDT